MKYHWCYVYTQASRAQQLPEREIKRSEIKNQTVKNFVFTPVLILTSPYI